MNKYTFNKAEEDYEKASSEYISARTEGSYNSCWRSSPELSFGCLEKYKERLESKKNKYNELRKERNIEIEKELEDVEKSRGTVVSAEIFLDNYIKKEEAKEAADKAEAEKARQDALAKEEAEKLHQQQETERLQREAEAAAAEKLHQQEEAKARAEAEEKVRQEAEARAEAEKLISEAKDIITNARHEIDIVKPELRNLLKDKKSEDLKTHLDKAQKVQVNVGSILSKMDKFSKEYQLEDAILTNFKDANNELKTTHNDQSTFISNLQEYDDLLDIKESIKSEEVIFDRYENKELEGHNQILPDHEEL